MKRYRIIIIGAITLLIAIFIGFTVRINMIFPNAKDVTYTSDNPPIIDGLKITPVDYNVYTIDEYREKFSNPFVAAARGYVDDVIEPATTRARLANALEMLSGKRETRPAKKHGDIPL